MNAEDERSRPANNGPAQKALTTTAPSLPPIADLPGLTGEQILLIHNWIADVHGVERSRLGFVAIVETSGGHYRRRALLSLESAHRAMERAGSRGLDSRIILCELRPVGEA